jgi:hypothetical protein
MVQEKYLMNSKMYKFDIIPKMVRCLQLDKNGQLVIHYQAPNGKEEYDFCSTPDQAAREAARRLELYNREHIEKIGDIEIDYYESGICSRQS